MIVLDTSVVLAMLSEGDSEHRRTVDWYQSERGPFATTPLVLAELDHLVLSRGGGNPAILADFHRQIHSGSLGVEWWLGLEKEAAGVADRYSEIGLGLTDASLVALAARLETTRIATFDERHFRAVEPLACGPRFQLLPADA